MSRHYAHERAMSRTIAETTVLPTIAALEHRVRELEEENEILRAANRELRSRIAHLDPGGLTAGGVW